MRIIRFNWFKTSIMAGERVIQATSGVYDTRRINSVIGCPYSLIRPQFRQRISSNILRISPYTDISAQHTRLIPHTCPSMNLVLPTCPTFPATYHNWSIRMSTWILSLSRIPKDPRVFRSEWDLKVLELCELLRHIKPNTYWYRPLNIPRRYMYINILFER